MGVSKKRRPKDNQVSPRAPKISRRHGGARAGAGRKPGSGNKRSQAVEPRADVAAGSELHRPHHGQRAADAPLKTNDNHEENGQDPAIPHPSEIARATCGILSDLRANLNLVVQNLRLIRQLADAETADDPARARLVAGVLSLPSLIKSANDLTCAIARLADLGPGKRETAMDLAQAADSGLFATPPAPKRTLQ